jgi:hypothetical protein
VGQLPAAMPKTIAATDQLLRTACPPKARHRALDLLLALAAVECHASTGEPPCVLPGLLRDLVIATTRLVGHSWLEANAEEAASFTTLQNSLNAPPLPELDHLLACLLSDRFGLSGESLPPGPTCIHPVTDAGRLDGQPPGASPLGPAERGGAHFPDVDGPVPAAGVPTWICLLRRVNLGRQRELPAGGLAGYGSSSDSGCDDVPVPIDGRASPSSTA